ncbi:MAG: sigma-70 family RNA polymerase sigma factor [Verrucomicrobiota bacterium]
MAEIDTIERGEAFARHFIASERRVFGLIFALVPNRSAAQDILQETGVRLWQKFDEFEEGTDFCAWALQVTRFVVLEWQRSQRKVPLPLDDAELHALADSYQDTAEPLSAIRAHLDECLAKLSDRQKSLVCTLYNEGRSVVEVASQWKLSRRAIHKLLKKTKEQLLACIERQAARDLPRQTT